MKITKETLVRAKDSEVTDSAYRGGGVKGTGRGERKRKPLRLPEDLWNQIAELQAQLTSRERSSLCLILPSNILGVFHSFHL